MPLRGHTILVSAGSARVADVAPALAAAGARLVLHAEPDQAVAVERVADALRARGAWAEVVRAPLRGVADAERVVAAACSADAPLRGLVSAPPRSSESSDAFDPAAWEAALTRSLKLPFFLARAAAARMGASGGAIVHLIEGDATSRVARAGLLAMTGALARSLPKSVRAAAVALPRAPATASELGALVAALLVNDSLPSGTVVHLGIDARD